VKVFVAKNRLDKKTKRMLQHGVPVWTFVVLMFLFPSVGVGASQQLRDYTVIPGDNDHPHNFSLNSTATIHDTSATEDRICVFCHTPHSSSSKGALWNRNDPVGPNGDGTFPLYGELSGRLGEIEIDDIVEAKYGPSYGEYPNGTSRLCLSCHDGVVAIGEVINPGGNPSPLGGLGNIPAENPASTAVIDLDTSHPISFVYDATVRDGINLVKGGGSDYVLPATSDVLDSVNRMQCTSCHDPHTDTNDGSYTLPMWKKYTGVENTDYEDTCSECHVGGSSSSGFFNAPVTYNSTELHNIP